MSGEQQPQHVTAPHFAPAGQSQQTTSSSGAGNLSSSTAAAVASRGTPATLNLDDIFGDCFFTPDGDAVFLSDQPVEERESIVGSAESIPSTMASRPAPPGGGGGHPGAPGGAPVQQQQQQSQQPQQSQQQSYVPVNYGGGISTTGLDRPNAAATVMGIAPPAYAPEAASAAPAVAAQQQQQPPPNRPVPFHQPPQQRHHLQYATPASMGQHHSQQQQQSMQHQVVQQGSSRMGGSSSGGGGGKRKTSGGAAAAAAAGGGGGRGGERKMSDRQKVERRERNREHAKRSRIRKKFLLESLQQSVALLKEENEKLRDSIRTHLGDEAEELLKKENLAEAVANGAGGLIAGSSGDANKVLDDPDFSFIKALQTAQQNFVVTDPSLPDNPIVYATQGFLNLTGYTLDQVLGRNCRFLQGPETDPKAVEKIRRAIEEGSDMSVCLLNYRVDGTTFWNQFFIAALRDAAGNITNYVGVQCKVSDQYAANVCKKQEEADAAAAEAEEDEAAGSGLAMQSDDGAAGASAAAAAPVPTPLGVPNMDGS